jgi:hypothetical protein
MPSAALRPHPREIFRGRYGTDLHDLTTRAQRVIFGSRPMGINRPPEALSHLAEVGTSFALPEKLARQYVAQGGNDRDRREEIEEKKLAAKR